jgi:hypothetical protein
VEDVYDGRSAEGDWEQPATHLPQAIISKVSVSVQGGLVLMCPKHIVDVIAIDDESIQVVTILQEKEGRHGFAVFLDVVLDECLIDQVQYFWTPQGQVPRILKFFLHGGERCSKLGRISTWCKQLESDVLQLFEFGGRLIEVCNSFQVLDTLNDKLCKELRMTVRDHHEGK